MAKCKKQIGITQAGTLNIGLYESNNGCTVYCTFRQADGVMLEDVYLDANVNGWDALHDALDELSMLKAKQCAVFTNHKDIADKLSKPSEPPAPDKVTKVRWHPKQRDASTVEFGGPLVQWNVLRLLTAYCRTGGWSIFVVSGDKLRKAKDYYASCYEVSDACATQAVKGGSYRSLDEGLQATSGEAAGWYEQVPLLEF